MKIVTVTCARPQFIKAAVVTNVLKARGVNEKNIYTGQHFNSNMSDGFLDELSIPKPVFNLGIDDGAHAENTGWVELVEAGWNQIVPPPNVDVITEAIGSVRGQGKSIEPYGKGRAAELVVNKLADK